MGKCEVAKGGIVGMIVLHLSFDYKRTSRYLKGIVSRQMGKSSKVGRIDALRDGGENLPQ